ncbi:MAG: hypothetical protein KDC05_09265 [Bacteroidales bacterium]|nr:hypothetical protein [Bacteroidales bacterium]
MFTFCFGHRNCLIHCLKLIFLVCAFIAVTGYTQDVQKGLETISVDSLKALAEKAYGPDDMLFKGLVYIPEHPLAKNHPYLTENDWNYGNAVIAGDRFINLKLKYNVNSDRLIIGKPEPDKNITRAFLPDPEIIDAFTIQNLVFENLAQADTTGNVSGFGRIIYRSSDMLFFEVYHKDFVRRYSQSNPYGAYSRLMNDYFIFSGKQLERVNSKRSFLRFFGPIRKQLKKYFRQQNLQYKKAQDDELNALIRYCEQKLSEISH